MSNKIKLDRGDVGDFYDPSDSDEEYTERERSLLTKVRNKNKKNSDSEDEVLAFDDVAGEDEDDEDVNEDFGQYQDNSDFDDENGDDDGIPDSRAWGNKRRDFHSTDFVDQDYSSYTTKEEELAAQEESEARAIQQRLAQELDEADFTLDVYGGGAVDTDSKEKEATLDESKIHLKKDLSSLSEREKSQLFKKDSPEFEGLVNDFEQRLRESQQFLEPILDYFNLRNLTQLPIFNFVRTKNALILTYCSNVAFYLVLKAKRVSIKNHPLVKRLVQMRQLLLQLEDRYVQVIRPQLEQILEDIKDGRELVFRTGDEKVINSITKSTKKLKFLNAFEKQTKLNGADDEEINEADNIKNL